MLDKASARAPWQPLGGNEPPTITATVVIVGLPSPAGCDPSRTWRAASELVATSLRRWCGDHVRVEYVELFSDGLEPYAALVEAVGRGDLHLPAVTVGGEIVSSGGKLRVSVVREALESRGLRPFRVGAADARAGPGPGGT